MYLARCITNVFVTTWNFTIHHLKLKIFLWKYTVTFAFALLWKITWLHPYQFKRGVLEGNSLSPLIFNICFNTLVITANQSGLKYMDYIFSSSLSPKNWLQFADNTSIVSSLETCNQCLLNLFTKWCTRAKFVVKVN